MSYTWTATPGGYHLAPCLQQLCAEIEKSPTYGPHLINDGELGNAAHTREGYSSDHNPFIIGGSHSAYPGKGYVRAIDLGGPLELLLKLRHTINVLYSHKFAPLWPFGYTKGPDALITTWYSTSGGMHVDSGDQGHLHVSVTQHDGNNPSPSGWVPALDLRTPWHIDGTAPVIHHPWPLKAGNYFGDIAGPNESHGGGVPSDIPYVTAIQRRLIATGDALTHNAAWADGKWQAPTTAALLHWRKRVGRNSATATRLYEADWRALMGYTGTNA